MRQLLLWTCLLAFACDASRELPAAPVPVGNSAELRQQQVLWRSHFVGTAKLESDRQAARWVKLAADPASVKLREQTLQKLATAPFRALQGRLPQGAKDQASLLQPLLADLFRAESYVEWRGTSNQTAQFVLALKLPDDRAKVCNANLSTVLKSWTGMEPVPFNKDGISGWQLRKHDAPDLIGVARSGQWLVLGLGQGTLSLFNDYIGHLKAGTAPFVANGAVWAEVWADWPQLQPRLPFHLPVTAPFAHLTVTGKDDYLRIKGALDLERALAWNPEPWRVPTNLIHDPLISFTAARGVGTVWQECDTLRDLKFQSAPNEVYAWSVSGSPFLSFLATRSADATNQIKGLAPKLTALSNPVSQGGLLGSIELSSNQPAIIWKGLPVAVPRLRPAGEGRNQYLFAGLFPNAAATKPAPPELLSQVIGRKDLAYYNWEVTDPKISQWKALLHLYQIATRRPMSGANPATTQWLKTAQKEAGNTVTEITVSGPRELTLTRKAPLGLTGFELVMLSHWLESANFPFSPYVPPQAPGSRPAPSAKPAAASAPSRR